MQIEEILAQRKLVLAKFHAHYDHHKHAAPTVSKITFYLFYFSTSISAPRTVEIGPLVHK